MEDNKQLSNGETLAGLMIIGCTIYGAAKLTQFTVNTVIDGSVWVAKKIMDANKKKKEKKKK